MRQLLLLRHAKSTWDDPRLSDHARPLNGRGRRAAAAVARAMQELGLIPDIVLVSSARRTLQTLESLSPLDGSPLIEPMDDLYLAGWSSLLDVLRGLPDTARSVLMIGHNPGLHELAMALVGAAGMASGRPDTQRLGEGYPTAALCEFAVALPWRSLEASGGRLMRFLTPADLPATEAGDSSEILA